MPENNTQAGQTEQLLTETKSAEELRAQRVWRLATVAWGTWVFFLGYFLWRGHMAGIAICIFEVSVIYLVIRFNRGTNRYRQVMNLTLGACAIGILLVSISEVTLRPTMLFYPVSILIASQLLGVRAAFYWLLINLLAQTIFYTIICGGQLGGMLARLDEIVLVYGVAICTFFCCHQGEAFYRERTKGLVDLSDQLRVEGERLHQLATTDSLTGLMNRYQFLQELREHVRRTSTGSQPMALLLIDLDGFKEINDTLGHPIGDLALVEVSKRLRGTIDQNAIVARLGGDEFCVILPHVSSIQQSIGVAQQLRSVIRRPYAVDSNEWTMDASLGIAHCPNDTRCPTELLSFADTAMFCAKSKRIGHEVYDPEMTRQLVENRRLLDQLSRALAREEFFLVYQPQVCLRTGRVVAVEALLRWRHEGRIVPPFVFIPLLEQSGEINTVGGWIVQQACRQLQAWHQDGYPIGMSINLSSVQFSDEYFEQRVLRPVRELGEQAGWIDFEITESLLVENVDQTAAKLQRLRSTGATISVDDFGTGYSSLAYLRQLPLDRLKIDRTFVKDIPEEDDGLIAKSITVLAQALGLKVLAEGVETETQLEFLKSISCDEYQGYFMSPPVSPEEVATFFQVPTAAAPLANPNGKLAGLVYATHTTDG